jgi:hypothetical protein
MALALLVAACGGGDGGSFLDQSPGATSAGDGLIPIGDLPTDVGDLPGVSGECEALLNLFLSIGGAFLGGEVSALDTAALAGLPGDVRADAQIVSDTLRDFSVGLQDMGINLADPASFATMTEAQQAAFDELTASLDSDQFNTASDNLSAYGDQQCESQFGPVG